MQLRASILVVALAALPAFAQPAPPAPGAAKPAPPALPPYVSAFADYRPWRDADPLAWSKANQEVGVVGGHAGTLRGTSPPERPSKPAAKPEVKQ